MWRIDHTQASLSVPKLSASINLGRPDSGLMDIVWQGSPIPGARLLQVHRPRAEAVQQLVDAYVRGPDLIAAYESRLGGAVAMQLAWRFRDWADLGLAGLELIVSVQTDLLDDDPELALASELPCCEVWQAGDSQATTLRRAGGSEPDSRGPCLGAGLFAYRFTNSPGSYLEMLQPTDLGRADCEPGTAPGTVRSRWRLFEERLEKGVIRRARACGLLCLHSPPDDAVAGECYRRWLASETPLST